MINFSETTIRSSSVGYLMTEPQAKADKEAGLLSKTAQRHLIDVYIAAKYDRRKDIQTRQMKKGIMVEDDSIIVLSNYLNKSFLKNQERFSNGFISGSPDIIDLNQDGITIYDIKSSYDLFTFLGNLPDKLDNLYYWQMQSYMWLTGGKKAYIAYCLVDTPDSILQQEKYYLLKNMDVISEDSPEFLAQSALLEKNLTFGDIDYSERVLLFPVERSEDDIQKIEKKVIEARKFLHEIEKTHLNFNLKK
jgi:hypothetical protein